MSSSIIKSFLFWLVSSWSSWFLWGSSTAITRRVWSAKFLDLRMFLDLTLIVDGSLGKSTNLRRTEDLRRVKQRETVLTCFSSPGTGDISVSGENPWWSSLGRVPSPPPSRWTPGKPHWIPSHWWCSHGREPGAVGTWGRLYGSSGASPPPALVSGRSLVCYWGREWSPGSWLSSRSVSGASSSSRRIRPGSPSAPLQSTGPGWFCRNIYLVASLCILT